MNYETDNRLIGRTNNPWNLDRTPGGSSGGEAAAIALSVPPAVSVATGVVPFDGRHTLVESLR